MAEITDPLDWGGWGSGGGQDDPYGHGGGGDRGGGANTTEPDGSNDAQLVYNKTLSGYKVEVWSWGVYIGIRVGGERRLIRMPDFNALVNAVGTLREKW